MTRSIRMIPILLALALLSGCSGGEPVAQKSEPAPAQEAPTEPDAQEPASGGVSAIPAETAAEKAAVKAASAPDGRKWAAGNPDGSVGSAEGDAYLGGYVVTLNDGKTQYQILVLGGKVVPFFGPTGDLFIASPFQKGVNPTVAPETGQQRAAVEAAKASIASTAPGATRGGIELYRCYFGQQEIQQTQSYPNVSIYADKSLGITYAMGGTESR